MTKKDGGSIKGTWVAGKLEGEGKEECSNGDIFSG